VIVAFINDHKKQFGVEPICRVLTEHGCKIAPSTYYDNVNRQASKQKLRDAELIALIEKARQKRFVKLFGARKMWLHLRGLGHDVARCTVERLMAQLGISGVTRGKTPRTTIADEKANRPTDRVDRNFVAAAPNRLWVADFTYVATRTGTVYVAFVIDVFSRRVVGWKAATQMTTPPNIAPIGDCLLDAQIINLRFEQSWCELDQRKRQCQVRTSFLSRP
jgi:putative transposase